MGGTIDNRADEIAVIGINGRFPQARNTNELWRNLLERVEAISFFTDEELIAAGIDSALLEQPNYIKARAVIEDYDLIDAGFFGLTPREAEIIDPQHRLFMECAWEVLEMAGYNPDAFKGSIGVYCGASSNTYLLFNLLSNRDAIASVGGFQTAISSALDFIATRVSYKFNLRGPSLTVQTACSTSLVAVHLACQSLLNGECDMALAGGVAINVPQKSGYIFEQGGILSPDGHCRPFDAKAQGTVPGSGAAIVLLKRMEDALADNDHIHAVIKGSAINNDGSQKIGYTAPSVAGQAAVIANALSVAGVSPETVTYVEAHGTGTTLGDPIEVDALTQVFRSATDKRGYCAIGSIKSNIGHLDAAAGTTGLIKAVLALEHKMLPPSLHYEEANPQIDFADSPFYVNNRLRDWKRNGAAPRRAGVSSFGIGGTNAHVVLEEAPEIEPSIRSRSPQVLLLSAKTSSALDRATENLAAHLRAHPQLDLADVAYTLQVGRKAFEHRRVLVAKTGEDAAAALESRDASRVLTGYQESQARTVVFMFPGQGAQYLRMAQGLYEEATTFQQELDQCADFLKPHLGTDLRQLLYPQPDQQVHRWIDPFETLDLQRQDDGFEETAARRLQQTFITQPAIFVVEYALAKQLMEWGIEPRAMIGHSIGEYVAACLAGVFELKDALELVVARGKLMQSVPAGSMLAVHLNEDEVQPLLDRHLSLASVNSHSLCVVAGASEAVGILQQRLSAQGVTSHGLHTSHAFHSQMMDSILGKFVDQVRRVKLKPPRIPFISNLTGAWNTEATNPDYWGRHLRHTVRFAAGLQELFKNPGQVLLEVGPGQTLSSLAKQDPAKKPEQVVLRLLRHAREEQEDLPFLLRTVGQLWLSGVAVNWPGLHAHHHRRRVLLPTYPFERQRYWIETQPQRSASRAATSKQSAADFYYLPVWKQSPLLSMDQTGAALNEDSCWLIFLDEVGLGEQIEARLEREGQQIVTVARGDGWKVTDETRYVINPRQRQDFDALAKDLKRRNLVPSRILHLWNVSSTEQVASPDAYRADDSFWSLLFVAQSLGAQNFAEQINIEIVSSNMQPVTGNEELRPEKATLLGPCRVIPQEYANLTCRSVDIAAPPRASDRESLIDSLLAEFSAPREQTICAYRGRQRWVQTFDEIHLDEEPARPSLLKREGVYLITGAQSETGWVFAEYLAESVKARLVLVAPSAYPGRDQWQTWLEANGAEGEVRRFIERVRRLEAAGVETLVVNADTSDEAQTRAAVERSIEKFGVLNGVLHTESVAGGGLIQLKTAKLASDVLRPKVRAALSFNAALHDVKLDFFALFSSSSALTGGIGQVDYCAANAFLDAFAHYRASRSPGLTVSIDWDPFMWEDWQGSQMGAAPDVQAQVKETLAAFGLTEQQSTEAFRRTLSSGLSQLIVSRREFQSILEQYRTLTVSSLMAQMGQLQSGGATHARPDLSTPYVAPRNETESAITAIWQELFGLERVGVHDKFFELGGSSLLAIQLITRLRNTFGEDVSMNSIFEQPTIAELAEVVGGGHLKQHELEEVERVYEELKDLSPEELEVLLADDLGLASGEDINA